MIPRSACKGSLWGGRGTPPSVPQHHSFGERCLKSPLALGGIAADRLRPSLGYDRRVPPQSGAFMFPIGDDNSQRRTFPYVTTALVVLNVLVFLLELSQGEKFITDWAFIPARFSDEPGADAATIFTAMFMHGGWMHLIGNMLFLWI